MGAQQRPAARPDPGKTPSLNGNEHAAGALLSGAARAEERPPRVLALTADIGEGHDLPAQIIKADLEEEVPGAEVEIANGLDAMGKIVAAVHAQRLQGDVPLDAVAVDIQYWLITKFAPARWFSIVGYLIGGRGLAKLIADATRTPSSRPTRGSPPCWGCCARPAPRHPRAVGDHRSRGLRYWAIPASTSTT